MATPLTWRQVNVNLNPNQAYAGASAGFKSAADIFAGLNKQLTDEDIAAQDEAFRQEQLGLKRDELALATDKAKSEAEYKDLLGKKTKTENSILLDKISDEGVLQDYMANFKYGRNLGDTANLAQAVEFINTSIDKDKKAGLLKALDNRFNNISYTPLADLGRIERDLRAKGVSESLIEETVKNFKTTHLDPYEVKGTSGGGSSSGDSWSGRKAVDTKLDNIKREKINFDKRIDRENTQGYKSYTDWLDSEDVENIASKVNAVYTKSKSMFGDSITYEAFTRAAKKAEKDGLFNFTDASKYGDVLESEVELKNGKYVSKDKSNPFTNLLIAEANKNIGTNESLASRESAVLKNSSKFDKNASVRSGDTYGKYMKRNSASDIKEFFKGHGIDFTMSNGKQAKTKKQVKEIITKEKKKGNIPEKIEDIKVNTTEEAAGFTNDINSLAFLTGATTTQGEQPTVNSEIESTALSRQQLLGNNPTTRGLPSFGDPVSISEFMDGSNKDKEILRYENLIKKHGNTRYGKTLQRRLDKLKAD